MHPKDIINDAVIGDKYFDPDTFKLYEYIKFGEYNPEWVDITPNHSEAANIDGWIFNDYNEIE